MINVDFITAKARKQGVEELTNSIVSHINLKLLFKSYVTQLDFSEDNTKHKVFDKASIKSITRQLARIGRNQKMLYESTLDSIAGNLSNPISMRVSGGNASITLKLKHYKNGFISTHSERLYPGWQNLSEKTLDIKSEGNFSKTYWKHTGRAAKAFKTTVTLRKKALKTTDFMTPPAEIMSQLNNSIFAKSEGVRGVSKILTASANVEVKVPSWVGKNKNLMDDLITKPYAGIKPNSMYSYLQSSMKAAQRKLAKGKRHG